MSISDAFMSSAAKLITTSFHAYVINVNECKIRFDVIRPFHAFENLERTLYTGDITNVGMHIRDILRRYIQHHKDIANVYRQYL